MIEEVESSENEKLQKKYRLKIANFPKEERNTADTIGTTLRGMPSIKNECLDWNIKPNKEFTMKCKKS